MFTRLLRINQWTTVSILPVLLPDKQNPKDIPAGEQKELKKPQTGFERVVHIFKVDEFGSLSKELLTAINTGLFAAFAGGAIAGLRENQIKFQEFVTKQNSNMYISHNEAKNHLTRLLAVSFLKTFGHFSIRLGFFTSLFTLTTNVLGAYNEKLRIWHFVASGVMTGSIYRIPRGARAMIAAGTVGGFLGAIAGSGSILLLKVFHTSYDEIENWHYEVRNRRTKFVEETMKEAMGHSNPSPELDERVEKTAGLEVLVQNKVKETKSS